METAFTPVASFGGGLLIGLAAVLLMLALGRVMGATGILTGALMPAADGERGWRIALLAGMVTAPLLLAAFSGAPAALDVVSSLPLMIAGGVLVGIGVTFGGGCTSGHGVCGNARLSARSVAATLTFMVATAATVYIVRHVIGV